MAASPGFSNLEDPNVLQVFDVNRIPSLGTLRTRKKKSAGNGNDGTTLNFTAGRVIHSQTQTVPVAPQNVPWSNQKDDREVQETRNPNYEDK